MNRRKHFLVQRSAVEQYPDAQDGQDFAAPDARLVADAGFFAGAAAGFTSTLCAAVRTRGFAGALVFREAAGSIAAFPSVAFIGAAATA